MSVRSLPAKNPTRLYSNALTAILAATLSFACAPERTPISIPFVATFNGTTIDCSSAPIALTDLRFYVSDIQIGEQTQLPLLRDDVWQTRDIALIDLENGSNACQNGTAATNSQLLATVPADYLQGLSFTIGVPFDLNHADPLQAEPPLNDGYMHWHWRSGYKFLRGGVVNAGDGFWLHLGSSGCQGRIGDISACSHPNRVRVTLPEFTPGDGIEIDLGRLLTASQLDDETPDDCSSGPAESSCTTAFTALGLPHGASQAISEQQSFRVRQ